MIIYDSLIISNILNLAFPDIAILAEKPPVGTWVGTKWQKAQSSATKSVRMARTNVAPITRAQRDSLIGIELRRMNAYHENMEMKLFRTKAWSALDIGLLKWSCILFGVIVGSYLAAFTKRYVWIFVIAAILLAIKPAISYFRGDEE